MTSDNVIKVATYPFSCPACGTLVKKGKNYIESEGVATCTCILPFRKLIPTGIRRLLIKEKTKA